MLHSIRKTHRKTDTIKNHLGALLFDSWFAKFIGIRIMVIITFKNSDYGDKPKRNRDNGH
ncbi:hypothetical protein IW01_06680 [Pectobacterium brasiliense]|nr:hypothetical protein IW01_06680 [Pectobacterium brasiliense]